MWKFSGWVGVGFGGNFDCRCGILYAPMLGGRGGGFAGLVSLTSSYFSIANKHHHLAIYL